MIDMGAVRGEVEAARGELVDAGNVKGILSLPARTRIWQAMLDPQDAERSYRCRTELKMACLRRVLPLWERAFPGDNRVQEMLNLTQGLIDASQDPDDAEMASDEFLADVYDEIEDFDAVTQPAAFVANGAVTLVGSALDRSRGTELAAAGGHRRRCPPRLLAVVPRRGHPRSPPGPVTTSRAHRRSTGGIR